MKKLFLMLSSIVFMCAIFFNNKLDAISAYKFSDPYNNAEVEVSQLEINNQTNFLNLGEITNFAYINDNVYYINSGFYVYNVISKINTALNFQNVTLLKQTSSHVLALANNKIIVLDNDFSAISIIGFDITCDYFNVFEENEILFIAYVLDNSFGLIKINKDNEIIFDRQITINNDGVLAIALNSNSTYAIFNNGQANKLVKIDNLTLNVEEIVFTYLNCSNLEIANFNGTEFLFLTSNNSSTLSILKENNLKLTKIKDVLVSSSITPSFSLGDVASFSDVKIINNLVYVSDKVYKSVQSFVFDNKELYKNEILVCGNGYDLGRFYGVNNILITNTNSYYFADTLNNRIQYYIDGEINKLTRINNEKFVKPQKILTYDNINFIVQFENKVTKINIDGTKISEIETNETIVDCGLAPDGNFYVITETKLLKLNIANNTFETMLSSNFNANSRIIILNNFNIAITNANKYIQIYNLENLRIVKSIEFGYEIIDLSSDYYNNLYALTNSGIYKIVYTDPNALNVVDLKINANFENITRFNIDKVTGEIIMFDNYNSKLIKVKTNDVLNLKNYEHVKNVHTATPSQKILSAGTAKEKVYVTSYPFNTNYEFLLNTNDKIYIIDDSLDSLYYCMYNLNNVIQFGYVQKNLINLINYEIESPQKYEVIFKNVKIYKYPTILKDNSNFSFAIDTVSLNFEIYVVNSNLISIDNSTYYAIKLNDNSIGYVNSSDVRQYSNTEIRPLPDNNASIYSPKENVKIYSENNTSSKVVFELDNSAEIYVENFDKNNEFTFVTYVDENQVAYSGYVLTKFIKLSGNNPIQTSAFIVLGVGIIILVAAIIVFVKQKKIS